MKMSLSRSALAALAAGALFAAGASSFVGGASSASASLAAWTGGSDKVHLKDGTVVEGEIVREVEGWVWLKRTNNGVEQEDMIDPKNISRIERASDAPGAVKPEAPKPVTAEAKGPRARGGGTPRAAILTLEGTVGIEMCAKPLREAIPLLKADGVDIVVMKINSGGGLLLEIQRLSDVIEKEYKPEFTTVAWIESAISAAAMTAHTIEDIYFMPKGNYGACTGFSGALVAVKGRGLEEVLHMMELISSRGKHPKEIMRAMQISGDDSVLSELQINPPSGKLSADIDEQTGEVRWFQDDTGKYILNPGAGGLKILTFNAEQAMKFKFARGIASTPAELAKQMGHNEIEWVGKPKKGFSWPVSDAEELQLKWRKNAKDAEDNFAVYFRDYQRNVATAQSTQDKQDRGAWINKARTALNFLRKLAKDQPNLKMLQGLSDDWFEQQDELLRKLGK